MRCEDGTQTRTATYVNTQAYTYIPKRTQLHDVAYRPGANRAGERKEALSDFSRQLEGAPGIDDVRRCKLRH